jgi:hypothetical protein
VARHPEHRAGRAASVPSASRDLRAPRTVALLAAALVVLSGCTQPEPVDPTSTPTGSSVAPSPSATATPEPEAEPVLVPEGTADENLPLFDAITAEVWASADQASGRAYVDALAAAGFDKAAMEVTHDTSTVGNPAESIQFSVRWGEQCLIGQVGPATGDPVAVVVPVLAEGTCLVGDTRSIDW